MFWMSGQAECAPPLQSHLNIDAEYIQAHLSRSLTEKPVYAHVLAIDNSHTQLSGSERLVDLTTRFQRSLRVTNDQAGSLTSAHCHLDAAEIGDVLARWPGDIGGKPSLLIALHACGDLTVNAIRAYLAAIKHDPTRSLRLLAVSCCYNLMSPTCASVLCMLIWRVLICAQHSRSRGSWHRHTPR